MWSSNIKKKNRQKKKKKNIERWPEAEAYEKMIEFSSDMKADGDTVGGIITGVIKGVPVGLGEPAFDKLHASLGSAMLSINAVKGFDYGIGFDCADKKGSEIIDNFTTIEGVVKTTSNFSGGIQGGISNGQDIYFRVAFKPVATLLKNVGTIDKNGNSITLHAKVRHDPCVVPRAVPIVEAMTALVILDNYLISKTTKL